MAVGHTVVTRVRLGSAVPALGLFSFGETWAPRLMRGRICGFHFFPCWFWSLGGCLQSVAVEPEEWPSALLSPGPLRKEVGAMVARFVLGSSVSSKQSLNNSKKIGRLRSTLGNRPTGTGVVHPCVLPAKPSCAVCSSLPTRMFHCSSSSRVTG